MKSSQPESLIGTFVKWVLTIVGAVLLVRLVILVLNVAFNFWSTPLGRLIAEGAFLDRMSDMNFSKIAVQAAIVLAIAAVLTIVESANSNKGGASAEESNERV
jgi:hypothetical protein